MSSVVMVIKPKDSENKNWFGDLIAGGLNTLIDVINNTSQFLGFGEVIAGQITYNEAKNEANLPLNFGVNLSQQNAGALINLVKVALITYSFLAGLEYVIKPVTKAFGGTGILVFAGAVVAAIYLWSSR